MAKLAPAASSSVKLGRPVSSAHLLAGRPKERQRHQPCCTTPLLQGWGVSHQQSPRWRHLKASQSSGETTSETSATSPAVPAGQNGAGASLEAESSSSEASASPAGISKEELPSGDLVYTPPSGFQKGLTKFKLLWALPWRRFKNESVLVIDLGGNITEAQQGRFGKAASMAQICGSLQKAAYDPRIVGVFFKISPLAAGWAKLEEIRSYIQLFRKSGKYTAAWMKQGGEKEYFVACACENVYVPPSAYLALRGLAVAGTFLRGALDKVGIEPQVKRIGAYKSAGDQLLRRDMSAEQREQLSALLEDIYSGLVAGVAESRGKSKEEVEQILDAGIYDMNEYLAGGWVTALKYEDEVLTELKKLTGGKDDELRKVGLRKYSKVSPGAFGLTGRKVIAVIRSSGAIVAGEGGGPGGGGNISADAFIAEIRKIKKNKRVAAVVLRIDSPGGDALASDLMWREIQELAKEKPVIASMGDVAASGGYYMAMGADTIIAEPLTITGSIGVVTGKLSLAGLYEKVGYAKEVISKGRYAEVLGDNRSFTPEEEELFDRSATFAYESFRNKAAQSRRMSVEAMQKVAQGRVWSGLRASSIGLVDALGGLSRAVAVAKQRAGIDASERVTLLELSREKMSPLALLTGGGASAGPLQGLLQLFLGAGVTNPASLGLLASALQTTAGSSSSLGSSQLSLLSSGRPVALEDISVDGVGSLQVSEGPQQRVALDGMELRGGGEGGDAVGSLEDVLRQLL